MSSRQVNSGPYVPAFSQPGRIGEGIVQGTQSIGGYFSFNTVGNGWIIKPEIRDSLNLPNFILANASLVVVTAFEELLSTGPNGAGTFRAFVAAIGIEQPLPDEIIEGEVEPNPRNDVEGTTVVIDFRILDQLRGGYLQPKSLLATSDLNGAEISGFAEIFKDEDEPVDIDGRFDQSYSTYADAYATINLLVPLEGQVPQIWRNGSIAPVTTNGSFNFYNYGDLSDRFFQEAMGIVSSSAYLKFLLVHEVAFHGGHVEANSISGRGLSGHAEVWSRLLSEDPSSRDLTFTTDDVRRSPVENSTYEEMLARGYLTGDGSIFLQKRVDTFQKILDGAISRLGLETIGDLIAAEASGRLTPNEEALIIRPVEGDSDLSIAVQQFIDGVYAGVQVIDGAQIGLALGSVLGKRISDNAFGEIAASGTLSTVLGAVGEYIDVNLLNGTRSTEILNNGIEGFGNALFNNIKGAGVGALSSYLTAELVSALGINAIPGEVANSVGGSVLNKVLTNLSSPSTIGDPFSGVNGTLIVNAVGSYLGSKLASEIKTFDNVGGQIGSAVGGIYGGFASTAGLAAANGFAVGGATIGSIATNAAIFAAANPVAAVAIVAAVIAFNTLLGGLIGSIFGGTPRSGADAAWDEIKGEFVVANVYSRKGGSKDAARELAGAVANNLNAILSATGAVLVEPSSVQAGNYGMRKKAYVYRPFSTREKEAITARFTGNDGATELVSHGTFIGLNDMVGLLAGGDIYVKRALAASIANAGGNPNSNSAGAAGDFDVTTLLGDVSIAVDYASYVENSFAINALIASAPQTSFSAGWLVTLARAVELGLHRRSTSDWIGGYDVFLDEATDGRIGGDSLLATQLEMEVDVVTGERYWFVTNRSGNFLGTIADTIEVGSQTVIEGTAAAETIHLSSTQLLATSGATNAGLTVDGAAHDGSALDIDVAATIDAGDGNDTVHASDRGDNVFGGAGNDTLYGGRLDDWLLGGDGDDVIHAGSQAGGLGGDGNYLDGGDGNDTLNGREGSDWLEGGAGIDILTGGGGGDILAGGAGDGDELYGGAGADQYLFRLGDGKDVAEDDPGGAGTSDPVADWLADLEAGTASPDWIAAGVYSDNNAPRGAEDSIVLGQGIGIADIQLIKGGVITGTTSNDLVIQIMEDDGNGNRVASGDEILIKDWYNSYKRVEWLAFADGQAIRIGDFSTFQAGTSGNDTIIGTDGRDFVVGGGGNDWMSLLGGADVGIGGMGDDFIAGDSGSDLLIGGNDDDNIQGGSGNDVLSGDAGADELQGGLGNDLLSGGRGDGDLLVGGGGDDIFRFSRGDGRTTIIDDFAGTWETVWSNGAYVTGYTQDADNRILNGNEVIFDGTNWLGRIQFDVDTQLLTRLIPPANGHFGTDATQAGEQGDSIEFGLGINIQDVMLAQYGYDLVLGVSVENSGAGDFQSLSDQILLKDWYRSSDKPIEKFVFAATGTLDTEDTNLVGGTDDEDTLNGTADADWITGNGGDDVIDAGDGEDILNGNVGHDILMGRGGRDVLYGGSGDDTLEGGSSADVLIGGGGSDTAAYDGAGAAVAVYLTAPFVNAGAAAGDTFSSIENVSGSSHSDHALAGDAGDNILSGGAGDDALFGGEGDDIYVWNAWDLGDTIDDRAFIIDQVVTANGQLTSAYQVTKWEATDVPKPGGGFYWRLQITGPGGEIVYDHDNYTPAGADPAVPTPSAYIQTGWLNGFDRVLNGVSNEQQVVRQRFDDTVDAGEDTLEMGHGISLSDLTFELNGSDLVVRFQNNAWNYVEIKNQTSANSGIEWLQFNDGLAVSLTNIKVATDGTQLNGTSGDDLLVGRTSADILSGGDGDDALSGLAGDDQLNGGAGDDVFEGGAGADHIDGGSNSAVGSSLSSGDTARYLQSSAITVDLGNTATGQSGGDAAGDVLVDIENVVGSLTGNDSITGDDEANRLFGMGGDDALTGLGGEDVLVGDAGDDVLSGGDGDDNLSGGDGNDQMSGGADNDLLDAGEGNDILHGDAGDDTLVGGDGADQLTGGIGDDVLVGDGGVDTLVGGVGNDQLTGGFGNDVLDGGAGDDIYSFSASSGNDVIVDTDGENNLVFDASVDFSRIWLTRTNAGADLNIGIIGSVATITISDFFATGAQRSLVHSIQTGTHALFLSHSDVENLIDAMTASSADQAPGTMPQSIADMLPTFWHAGGKAAPRAEALTINTDEDVSVAIADLGVIDHDNNIVEYSISADPEFGTITNFDAVAGTFTYTPDLDVNGADSMTVIARDADGHSVEIPISFDIAPVNDAPRNIAVGGNGILEVDENTAEIALGHGAVVGQLTAFDPEGDPVTWSLLDDAGGRFVLTADGELQVETPASLDYEQDTSHTITVQAADGFGAFTQTILNITITNVNETPDMPVLSESDNVISEYLDGTTSSLAGHWLARFALSDPDGTTPTLRLVDDSAGRFKIVGNEVQFADGYEPDFETLYNAHIGGDSSVGLVDGKAILTYSVEAYDGTLASGESQDFEVKIEDVNEAPTSLDWTSAVSSVDERDRVATGTLLPAITLGTLSVQDPDIDGYATDSYVYSVTDPRFEIVGDTLRLKLDAVLDYEAGDTVSVTVTATDQTANPFTIDRVVTITINNVDDVLEGDDGANILIGQQNRDLIYGFGGDDRIDGAGGNDRLDGGDGDDRLIGGSGGDILIGWADNDVLFGGSSDDSLYGKEDDDDLSGGTGGDYHSGGSGIDRANYAWLDDGVAATAGVTVDLETPSANTGIAVGDTYNSIENLLGTGYADVLRGTAGINVIEGGGGGDTLQGRAGNDTLRGGSGNDTLHGDEGADLLEGGDGDDIIHGGAGNDTLLGGAGDDQLYADGGDDYLDGGVGNDILNGGIDNDTYIVTRQSGMDTVYNYDPSGDDVDVLGFQDTHGAINDEDLWFERIGDDMKISVIGTTSSVLIMDWYNISDPVARENYMIDFIVADQRYTTDINVDGLVTLMAAETKPTTVAQRDALMADTTYLAHWATHWGTNDAPVLGTISAETISEDGTLAITVNATDDITPLAGIQMSATLDSGDAIFENANMSFGQPDAAGNRILTITPNAHASGVATIRVQATDVGGVTSTRLFTVTVNAVADTPTITLFAGGAGTAGQSGGIPLNINTSFPDMDGSEVHEVRIWGVPSGVTLSAGTYHAGWDVWRLSPAQLLNLKVNAPAGWSDDLSLSARVYASENGQTAQSAAATTTVIINAAPTGATLSGSVNENRANGTTVGTVTGIDPDAGDNLTYALVNNAGGRFNLTSGGTLKVANGSLLNYEAATSHGITVRVTDSFGQIKDKALTVAVNDVNEANSLPTIPLKYAAENKATGTLVTYVTATDLDLGGTTNSSQRYYFLHNGQISSRSWDNRYRITGSTGRVSNDVVLNYEAGNIDRTYQVVARDRNGGSGYKQAQTSLRIKVTDVNEANALPSIALKYASEAASVGSVVTYLVKATDLDLPGTTNAKQRYYFLNGSTISTKSWDNRYKIDNLTGNVTINAALNYEAGNIDRTYKVIARDNNGGSGYNQAVTDLRIKVTDVNEANNLPSSYSKYADENKSVGSYITYVTATDVDLAGTTNASQRYYFLHNGQISSKSWDNRYKITSSTGRLSNNIVLNYEAGNTDRTYQVVARDRNGGSGYKQDITNVRIRIRNVNEAPVISNQTFSRPEQPANPTAPLISLAWSDVDGKPANGHRFTIISGNSGGYWSVNNAGQLSAIKTLNYENSSYRNFSLRVRVTDQSGNGIADDAYVTINLTNVNEAPNPSAPANMSFSGGVNSNTLLGAFSANDPDAGAQITYSIQSVVGLDFNTASLSSYRVDQNGRLYTNSYRGGAPGKHKEQVTVRVTDGQFARTASFIITYKASQPYFPIVLDLDGDGLELVSRLESDVYIDVDGDGILDRTGWVAPDDGLLALDRNGDGIVTDVGEISFAQDVSGAVSDLEGLRAFDTDSDGFIDADDERFEDFRVWRDLNQDGISQTEELQTLTQAGIAFVNLMLNLTGDTAEEGDDNVIYATGEFIRDDGSVGTLGDVAFSYEPSVTQVAPPIVLDLDGDGVTTTTLAASNVRFDMDGDGVLDRTGWAGPADGLLALDRNGDGLISGIGEISFIDDLPGAKTDLEGLSAFDTNGDGLFSAADERFGEFRVWIDANQDGVSDADELSLLAELGIVSIDLEGTPTGDPSISGGNVIYNESTFLRGDGSTGAVGDVGLAFISSVSSSSATTGENPYSPDTFTFDRKSKKYLIQTQGGSLNVQLGRVMGPVDGNAGEVPASAILKFKNRSVGLASTLILDLDGDGVEMRRRKKSKVGFDMNADGIADDTGWLGKGDAFLALDRNGNGAVDGIGELSFMGDLPGASSSLAGLRAFDSNRDGILDEDDEKFADFRVWHDRNRDGTVGTDEFKTLAEMDITSISLGREAVDAMWRPGRNIVLNTATFTRGDGSTSTIGDVALAYRPSVSRSAETISIESITDDLGDRPITGLVGDRDTSILTGQSVADRHGVTEQIVSRNPVLTDRVSRGEMLQDLQSGIGYISPEEMERLFNADHRTPNSDQGNKVFSREHISSSTEEVLIADGTDDVATRIDPSSAELLRMQHQLTAALGQSGDPGMGGLGNATWHSQRQDHSLTVAVPGR